MVDMTSPVADSNPGLDFDCLDDLVTEIIRIVKWVFAAEFRRDRPIGEGQSEGSYKIITFEFAPLNLLNFEPQQHFSTLVL